MAITCFETRGISLIVAIETVENVKNKFKKVEYSEGITFYKKFELILDYLFVCTNEFESIFFA